MTQNKFKYNGSLLEVSRLLEHYMQEGINEYDNITYDLTGSLHIRNIKDTILVDGINLMTDVANFIIIEDEPYEIVEYIPAQYLGKEFALLGYVAADMPNDIQYVFSIMHWTSSAVGDIVNV